MILFQFLFKVHTSLLTEHTAAPLISFNTSDWLWTSLWSWPEGFGKNSREIPEFLMYTHAVILLIVQTSACIDVYVRCICNVGVCVLRRSGGLGEVEEDPQWQEETINPADAAPPFVCSLFRPTFLSKQIWFERKFIIIPAPCSLLRWICVPNKQEMRSEISTSAEKRAVHFINEWKQTQKQSMHKLRSWTSHTGTKVRSSVSLTVNLKLFVQNKFLRTPRDSDK